MAAVVLLVLAIAGAHLVCSMHLNEHTAGATHALGAHGHGGEHSRGGGVLAVHDVATGRVPGPSDDVRLGRSGCAVAVCPGDQPDLVQPTADLTRVLAGVEALPALPGCDGEATGSGLNGQVPESELCALWDGCPPIRADAAVALARLNQAYTERFGELMCLTDGYRSYALQVAAKAAKPTLTATPGRSNHGWGLAVDICADSYAGWCWVSEGPRLDASQSRGLVTGRRARRGLRERCAEWSRRHQEPGVRRTVPG